MKTLLLRIVDYKGIDNLEIRPGTIAALRGGNGRGKTTVLDALRSLAEGGSEPHAINKAADEALIKLVIEVEPGDHPDYVAGRYEIERKIKRDGYDLKVKNPAGARIKKEQTFVDTFLPKIGFDPVSFDLLTDTERASELERFLRVKVTQAEIRRATSLVEVAPMAATEYPDGIAQIDVVDAELEKRATEIRAEVKALGGSIATFEKALEGKSADDVKAELSGARTEYAELVEKLATETAAFTEQATTGEAAIDDLFNTEVKRITAWYEEQLATLNKERLEQTTAASKAKETALRAGRKKISESQATVCKPLERRITELEGQIEVLEGKAERAAQLTGERAQLQAWRDLRITRSEQLESITIARGQLDKLRMKKLETCELPDLKTIKGELYLDGILSSEVNSARRIMKWVEVATKFSEIPGQLIIVDELEKLEDANLKIFEEAMRASGLQLFAARLDSKGGPLRVDDTLIPA